MAALILATSQSNICVQSEQTTVSNTLPLPASHPAPNRPNYNTLKSCASVTQPVPAVLADCLCRLAGM
jgi:hypothetical protein